MKRSSKALTRILSSLQEVAKDEAYWVGLRQDDCITLLRELERLRNIESAGMRTQHEKETARK